MGEHLLRVLGLVMKVGLLGVWILPMRALPVAVGLAVLVALVVP